jgi:hypothetical protein
MSRVICVAEARRPLVGGQAHLAEPVANMPYCATPSTLMSKVRRPLLCCFSVTPPIGAAKPFA